MDKEKYLQQLSIFIENHPGELHSITSLLESEGISLLSITLADSSEFGILRILTKEVEYSKKILIENGFMAQSNNVLGVRISDQVGSFNKVVKILSEASINIRYTYTVNEKDDGIFIFKIEDKNLEEAAKLLETNGVEIVKRNEL